MAAAGHNPHGEADLVAGYAPRTVLDAGCGTGRVAIELASRGVDVVGVDLDADMLAVEAAPSRRRTRRRRRRCRTAMGSGGRERWVEADLARLDLGRRFDVVVLAGNVLLFVAGPDRSGDRRRLCTTSRAGRPADQRLPARPGRPTLAELDLGPVRQA